MIKNGVVQVRDPVTGASLQQPAQTSQATFQYDQVSSDLSNRALQKLKDISLSAGDDDYAAMIFVDVRGFVRLPSLDQAGNASGLVVLLTDLGRIILNGTDMQPASGAMAAISDADLFRLALAEVGKHVVPDLTAEGALLPLPLNSNSPSFILLAPQLA